MSKQIQIIPLLIVGVLALGGGFFGGMQYSGSADPRGDIRGGDIAANLSGQFRNSGEHGDGGGGQDQRGGDHPNGAPGRSRGQGGGALVGEIIGVEDGVLTIKTRDGGSKIVFFSEDVEVRKVVSGTVDGTLEGEQAVIFGQENPDGSYSAQSLQFGLPVWTQ